MLTRFPPAVAARLGFYIYLYSDPRDGSIFYVGKGQGDRAFFHLNDPGPSEKVERIAQIRAAGMEPIIEVLVHGLETEELAFKLEASIIDLLGKGRLTNAVLGYHSASDGRMTASQIIALYGAQPVTITEPTLLIRINRLYRHTMSATELYEATRGVWRLGSRREGARLAMAVYQGVVREVYEIESWHPAWSTPTSREALKGSGEEAAGRWEFVGRRADEGLRDKYVNGSVAHYLPAQAQNPILYVNVP